MLTFSHRTAATLPQRAWIAPVAFWLQSEPITISCCSCLGPHFSFIHHSWWEWRRARALFPPLSFRFLLSSPREDHCLGRNSKYSWMLDGISETRYEGAGVGKRLFPLYPIWQTCPHAHEHTYTHTFFFFLEHFLSLLQKGESGQKSRSLITLSSNIILIFRCCKGELWKRNATAETKWDDEWKMKDKMKWMKNTEGKGKEYEKEKEHGGGGQWREKVHKSMLVFMLWIILQF